jgi:hypothetical protein
VHEPFDIISVHIYPGEENNRFGRPQGHEYEMVGDAAAAARESGKPLFVGEFGDGFRVTPFLRGLLQQLIRYQVEYSAIWVWEFYQENTYQTHNTAPTLASIEPGYSDDVIALLQTAERALGSAATPNLASSTEVRVILTWPLPCAVVDSPVDLAAVASTGIHAVRGVDFRVNGKFLATSSAPPYYAYFDPAGLGERTAELEAIAEATDGAVASFKSTVKFNGTKPTCSLGEK